MRSQCEDFFFSVYWYVDRSIGAKIVRVNNDGVYSYVDAEVGSGGDGEGVEL